MRIIPISEGSFTIDGTKKFVPFDNNTDKLKDRSSGSLLVEVQPFVIITDKDVLLLDTGLGFEVGGKPQLHHNLINAGINPGDVTKVLMTHLHKDHAGGIGVERDGLGGRLSLPNATYYVQQQEMAFAKEKGLPSFIPEELECLYNNDRVQLLQGEGILDGYIEYKITGGHSPFHQAFWIRDNEQIIFFGGDEAPQLNQMKNRFVAKYDYDGKKAMDLRQQWWQQGEQENWSFLFYHDVKNPTYSF